MVCSMTGFGRGTAEVDGISATVELRSVNKRFFETSIRMPGALAARETDVQRRLKRSFERGRISAQAQVEGADEEMLPIEVDPEAAHAYKRLLEDLRTHARLDDQVSLQHMLQFSEVFTSVDRETSTEASWPAVREALEEAIADLQTMRAEEGQALLAELEAHLATLETELRSAETRAPIRVDEARAKLHERLADLLEETRVNPERLETELAILADKLDVTEECVRLDSHLQLFREALAGDEAVGRKLNFIVQEMHREVNTIGSKANDTALSHGAVRMKEAIEKIREQVQNVE